MEQELAGVFGEWQIAELIEYDELGVTHQSFGDPTLADAILDRLVHNAHRLELKGETMRPSLETKS